MTDYLYTLEKFSAAVGKLATEPEDILGRLPAAAMEIVGMTPSHVPEHLSGDVQWIKERVIPEYHLTEEEAVLVAHRICRVEAELRS